MKETIEAGMIQTEGGTGNRFVIEARNVHRYVIEARTGRKKAEVGTKREIEAGNRPVKEDGHSRRRECGVGNSHGQETEAQKDSKLVKEGGNKLVTGDENTHETGVEIKHETGVENN